MLRSNLRVWSPTRWRKSQSICRRCYSIKILGKEYDQDAWSNVSSSILPLIPRKLHLQKSHPISILRRQIESQFSEELYAKYNDYSPVVTVHQNFDSLGFPKDHVGRSKSDTYYVNEGHVLRTHTSAHQADTFHACDRPGFLISADVYRRDEIDRSHYPVFHQTEGARSWTVHDGLVDEIEAELEAMPRLDVLVEDPSPPNHETRNPVQAEHGRAQSEAVARHLKRTIEGIAAEVFGRAAMAARQSSQGAGAETVWETGEPLRVRWIEAYFPFTSPSWELEVWWNDEWLELCGCGVVRQDILEQAGRGDRIGWAFGLGLERIAMILFGIPDIRLFWSQDARFLTQFSGNEVVAFREYSKYPANRKDMSFWVPEEFQENDFMEIARTVAGDLIEDVKLVDTFVHPKTQKQSRCYRINYRSMDRSLTNEEINGLQARITQESTEKLNIKLR
ncbi:Phenylalanyl-tRNA synthetase,mitochondrial [Taphrina deformans PYCC 5710]|uniref:Phenylalanine--tRNA ligase, mitochondrial n=1 Tax=Taphrina deformans (strain PYCC 5710 / ATCC 11124 / CBS 356.35 / IMI 108563 / JCM 9778 / NBRC 8474) TaxID=1097556 RepID=R4X6T3_TAPDE|nr:Phenylalanyl-tRNA synthetase,mitochondrial [Taphrina deformans PYCC 5710]|eukprot:CCG80646.1 Phenylalanyl-tRNA synthetase,mitochondrial [Taphrina deformans PYCC 5710]